jgi:ATP-binding cassette subfamily B protein RaxB
MLANFHGHKIDMNALRQRFPISGAGASLKALMELADRIDIATRAVRCDLEGLKFLSTPAVLHWDLKHYVVLERVKGARVVIHDPSKGRRTLTLEEVSAHFTGVAMEAQPAQTFTQLTDRSPVHLSSLWQRDEGFWSSMALILGLSIALQITAFAMPFYLQLVVDQVIARGDAQLLNVLAVGFSGLVLIGILVEALRAYSVQVVGHLLGFQIIGNLVRHLLRLKIGFFEKRHIGDILSRIQSARPIQQAMSEGVIAVVIDGAMASIALLIMCFYSPLLASVVAGAAAASCIATFAFYPHIRRRSEEQISAAAVEQSHLIESVRGAKTIRLWGAESARESQWRSAFASAVNASFSVGKLRITQRAVQNVISGMQTILIVFLATKMILAAEGFSLGMMIAFLSFRQTFSDRLNALLLQGFELRLLSLHLDRLGDIVNSSPDSQRNSERDAPTPQGDIELRSVSFKYGETDPHILEGLSLTIQEGEFLAITGPSGGGKTTLLKLLLGMYEPTAGKISIGGTPMSASAWPAWRATVGVVTQDDQLFSGSLAENIAFFDPEMDMDRVRKAAARAEVERDIDLMPMQFMTMVGDMGSTLSGGQRQRVLLARALYREPKVLILDEGTANLDPGTERLIADTISEMDTTRIVVAHRRALIERASRVVEIVDGLARETSHE